MPKRSDEDLNRTGTVPTPTSKEFAAWWEAHKKYDLGSKKMVAQCAWFAADTAGQRVAWKEAAHQCDLIRPEDDRLGIARQLAIEFRRRATQPDHREGRG